LEPDRGHVKLALHHRQVGPEGQLEPFPGSRRVRQRVQRGVEGRRPGQGDVGEQVGLVADMRVQRALLDAQRGREVVDRRAVVAALREHAGGLRGQPVPRRQAGG